MTVSLLLLAALSPAVLAGSVPAAGLRGEMQDAPPPPCGAVVQWANDTQMTVNRREARPLTLFAAESRNCGPRTSPTVIRFSAVYFDRSDRVICGGPVDLPVYLGAPYTHVEVQPGNLSEFFRWSNGPLPNAYQWHPLVCRNPDGQATAQPASLEQARSMRLHATVLPSHSGVAVAELRMVLQ